MLRALIFDCDGVLADTEPLHCRAMTQLLKPRGIRLTWKRYRETLLGMTDPDMFRRVLADGTQPPPAVTPTIKPSPVNDSLIAELVRAKAAIFPRILARHVKPMPGVIRLIRRAAKRLPLAICSGAYRADIETIVAKLGVGDCFRLIVSCEDVQRGKPDPQGYRLALRRLNKLLRPRKSIRPNECVVIEDSPPGMKAAKAAGMRVIDVRARAELAALVRLCNHTDGA